MSIESRGTAARAKPINVIASSGKPWMYSKRGYALAQSFKQLKQRKLASLVTLMVFGITMALPAIIWFTADTLTDISNKSVSEESITAYLTLDTSDLDGATLAQSFKQRVNVQNTRYVSRDEALATFNEQANISDALAVLGENPLPGAIIVYPDSNALNDSAIDQLASTLRAHPNVERVQFDLLWVKRLQSVLQLARTIGWLLAGFLTLTALLVIGNTIRLELLRRQAETDVSRLLGANRTFLNRPLLYTGALLGLLGGLLACVIAYLALHWIQGPTVELSQLYSSAFKLIMPTASQFLTVVLVATFLGILGASATLFQTSRQLLPVRRTGI
jgi:cell division transport system permease protein